MSSFSRAFFICVPRVWLLQAWPWKKTARRLSFCERLALSSMTPSIQRETGMPGMFMVYGHLAAAGVVLAAHVEAGLDPLVVHAPDSAQCFQEPSARP